MTDLDSTITEGWIKLNERYEDHEVYIFELLVQYMKRNKAFLFADN